MPSRPDNFVFYLSCDINLPVRRSSPLPSNMAAAWHPCFCPCSCTSIEHLIQPLGDAYLLPTLCLPVQVRVRIDRLLGRLPALQHARPVDGDAGGEEARAPALYVVAALCALGEVLALPARSPYTPATQDGCTWGAWLTFPIKARAAPERDARPELLSLPLANCQCSQAAPCTVCLRTRCRPRGASLGWRV